jgi:hypothetical protein
MQDVDDRYMVMTITNGSLVGGHSVSINVSITDAEKNSYSDSITVPIKET